MEELTVIDTQQETGLTPITGNGNTRITEIRKCLHCGSDFYPWRSNARIGGGRYCSKSCSSKVVSRNRAGKTAHNWKGGRKISDQGYVLLLKKGHPRSDKKGYVREHVLIAQNVLGKPLPKGAVVHHINGNHADNRLANLVICENKNYHNFIHKRMREAQNVK